jgi:hypothetical protein
VRPLAPTHAHLFTHTPQPPNPLSPPPAATTVARPPFTCHRPPTCHQPSLLACAAHKRRCLMPTHIHASLPHGPPAARRRRGFTPGTRRSHRLPSSTRRRRSWSTSTERSPLLPPQSSAAGDVPSPPPHDYGDMTCLSMHTRSSKCVICLIHVKS